MKKAIAALLLTGFVGAAAFLGWNFLRREAYPEKVFPGDTLVFVELKDRTEAEKNWDQTAFGKAIAASPRKETYKRLKDRAAVSVEDIIGTDPRPILDQFTGVLSLAVFPAPSGKRTLGAVLYVDSPRDLQKYVEQKLDPGLRRRIPDLRKEQATYANDTYYKYSTPKMPEGVSFCFGISNHHLLFASSEEGFRKLLDVRDGKLAPLKKDPLYSQAKKDLSFDRGALLFVNAQSLLQSFQGSVPERMKTFWPTILGATGIEAVESFATSVKVDKDGFVQTGVVAVRPERKGLVKLFLDQTPRSLKSISMIPSDIQNFAAGTLPDFKKMDWNSLGMMQGGLAFAEAFLHLSIRHDILESLGDEYAMLSNPGDAFQPDLSSINYELMAQLRDPQRFDQALQKLVSMMVEKGIQKEQQTHRGRTLTLLPISPGQYSFSPAFTVHQNWFYVSSSPEYLSKVLDAQDGALPSIASTGDYKKVTGGFPDKLNALTYTNIPAQLLQYSESIKKQQEQPGMEWMREYQLGEECAYLSKLVFGGASYSVIESNAIRFYSYSSTPNGVLYFIPVLPKLPELLRSAH